MNSDNKVKDVIIVGGGTAGWLTASLLIKVLGRSINIRLIESEKIGIIGVGEATIPPIIAYNNAIGVNESDFIKATKGTIKLGIQFENWGKIGDSYMHAFGDIGKNFPFCEFHHFWVRSRQLGYESDFWDYSLNFQTATNNKFAKLNSIEGTNLAGIQYAYHFDAALYAKFLSENAQKQGVVRTEGTIKHVSLKPENGFVESVTLEDETVITGDLFVDCTGLHSLLIEKTLNTGYEDWNHWLPCDRAVAMPSKNPDRIRPYTRAIAHPVGWQWNIPLQHRTGNGLVYSSKHLSDDEAVQRLKDNIDTELLGEPNLIKYRTGRRRKQWNKNVVCIGLSAGFFEPLESTNLHLIQTGAIRLLKYFPHNGIQDSEVSDYNKRSQEEYERIRDFIILHYKQNMRDDTDFWRQCRQMDIPDTLKQKMELFKSTGKVFRELEDLFTEIAWKQVLIGQRAIPEDYHPMVDSLSKEQIFDLMDNLKKIINSHVNRMPTHEEFLKQYM